MYTNEEYFEMLMIYGECGRNATAASRTYAERFPNRNHPTNDTILLLANRTRTTGKVSRGKSSGALRVARTLQNEEAVLAAVEEEPTRSIRTVSRILNITKSTTCRILRDNRKHPFHYTRVQNLLPEDYPARLQFCRWILARHEEDPNFLRGILFSDESTFTRQGAFNTHNFHVWADVNENPHAFFQRSFQHRFSLNLWAGIFGDSVVGPFEFPETLNGEMYANFLQHNLQNLLEDVPLENFANVHEWFQHDGAPPHYARRVREILNNRYPDSWIGRGGPINWPARSPDLTPLDFFLWGHVKNYVYRVEINSEEQLRQRIAEAFRNITPEMVSRCRESILRRARLCIQMHGGHFEHLL